MGQNRAVSSKSCWQEGHCFAIRALLMLRADHSDTLCWLRLKLPRHPAFGTPSPMGEGSGLRVTPRDSRILDRMPCSKEPNRKSPPTLY